MLKTPLGNIVIIKNGKEVDYLAEKQNVDSAMQITGLAAQSYQIDVDFEDGDSVFCVVQTDQKLEQGDTAMGLCACKVVYKGQLFLTIGCMETFNDCRCINDWALYGIGYSDLKTGEVNKVSFAVSWVDE